MTTEIRAKRRWRVFWLCLMLVVVGFFGVSAALVDLDATVSFSIYQSGGTTPLANGSVVYIIGSSNSVIDPMLTYGPGGTNYIAYPPQGDDVILGIVRIGDNVTSNGTFFTTVQYDSDQVKYVYIRFFQWTGDAVGITGMVWWGESSNYFIGPPTLGVSSVDFNPNTNNPLISSNYNNFVVIPEPGTANLLLLVAGMGWAMRHTWKKNKRASTPPKRRGSR